LLCFCTPDYSPGEACTNARLAEKPFRGLSSFNSGFVYLSVDLHSCEEKGEANFCSYTLHCLSDHSPFWIAGSSSMELFCFLFAIVLGILGLDRQITGGKSDLWIY
jgi:hypothetical protein